MSNSISQYTLSNSHGMSVDIINYGGTITRLHVPDKHGNAGDVVLGFETSEEYMQTANPFFGCIAGRYANRIAKGKFSIGDKQYQLPVNNGPNSLHGGKAGFNRKFWDGHLSGNTVSLDYTSADGEEGYPGRLTCRVEYTLTEKNELRIDYTATTDKPTIINLTNHTYFNLSDGVSTIDDHIISINADRFVDVNEEYIPTGELKQVGNTPMDLRQPLRIGDGLPKVKGGYDHTWVFNEHGSAGLAPVVTLHEPVSGRVMEVMTTQPGTQFYTANFLNGTHKGKNSVIYPQHAGLCLETQHFPDSPNQPSFPSTLLSPGEEYRQTTIYRFSVK